MYLDTLLLTGLVIVANANQAEGQTTTSASAAGSCPTVLTSSSYDAPVVGTGYTAQLVVTGLTKPRGLIFDKSGALLVVESGVGITRIHFDDRGGTCLLKDQSSTLISDNSVSNSLIRLMAVITDTIGSSTMVSSCRVTAGHYMPRLPRRSTLGRTTLPPKH